MQKVNWNRPDLLRNLLTSPCPHLTFLDGLYIDWGVPTLNLTPLPLYGNLLSDECRARADGNAALMYDSVRGWIPIADHIYRSNPAMSLRLSHIYDYAKLWERAELALQQCLKWPRRYAHSDLRFRTAWLSGKTEAPVTKAPRGLSGAQRLQVNKRKQHCIETAGLSISPGNSTDAEVVEGTADLSDRTVAELEEVSPVTLAAAPLTEEDSSEGALDMPSERRLHRDQPIMLEWSTDAEGASVLVIAAGSTIPAPRVGSGGTLLTALSKGAHVCQELSHGDQKCSKCLAGMCPPGIRFCTSCKSHWVHIHCTPLLVRGDGIAFYLCQGCKFYVRSYMDASTGPFHAQRCASCHKPVVDNSSGTVCDRCNQFFHAVCAMTAHPLAEDCFLPNFFAYSDVPRPQWICVSCLGDQPAGNLAGDKMPTLSECRLPLPGDHAPGITVKECFFMHLSARHERPLLCQWQLVPFTTVRHGADFRHLLQFVHMLFPEVDEKLMLELAQNPRCRLLSLQSIGHSGGHWLSFVLFGQTPDGGIPVILLHAVHPALQRQGLGRWGLQLLYRQCAKTRDMLLHTQPVDLGFYTHMGFVKYQGVDDKLRFKQIGGDVWKRSHIQGAVLDLRLSEVVSSRMLPTDRSQLHRCRWLCPQQLAFQTLPGSDVCFAATMFHMLLSIPQLVAHFSTYESRPHSTGALIARCLAHLWQNQQDPDGPSLVALTRSRLQGDFGQTIHRPKAGNTKSVAFAGQHDVGDFEQALFKALTMENPQSDVVLLADLPEQPTSYQDLVTSLGTEVRCCQKCGSRTHREVSVAWILQLDPTRPVTTLADLLEPVFSGSLQADRPLDQPGCRRRNCVHRAYTLFTSIRSLAPVIQLTVNRGMYATETTQLGAKALVKVEVPLRFTFVFDGAERLYLLRSVSFSSGGLTISSGHYTAGKIHDSQLEHCSHTTRGASISLHTIPSPDFLQPTELRPPLPDDHVISTAWYSLAVGDESRVHSCNGTNRWVNHTLQALDHVDRPLSPSDLGESPMVEPGRPRSSRSSKPGRDLVAILCELIPPEQALRITRGDETLADYYHLVQTALRDAEEADVPVLFWTSFDQSSLASLGAEMDESEALTLNTMGSTSSRGRKLSLGSALKEVNRSRGGRDPFTSTNALSGGLYQSSGGKSLLTAITAATGLELTGGCSLLVSEPGVITPCHFHAPGVINFALGFATCHPGSSTVQSRHPEIGMVFPCTKEYVLFVTSSLEDAGISLYNLNGTISLASLVARIRCLSPTQRDRIRWFLCNLDGMEFNSLYMPGTMLHHVSTKQTQARTVKGLYWGIASEAVPLDLASRQTMLRRLERLVPTDGAHHAPVASLKHIAQQSTSDHSLHLLRHLVRHSTRQVKDFATWYEARDLVQLWRRYNNAYYLLQKDQFQHAEQILLDLVKELARTAAAPWWGVVQHSLSALSDVLTATATQRSARILRAHELFEHGVSSMEPHFVLQPLIPLSSMTQGLSERARQSVGPHGDNT